DLAFGINKHLWSFAASFHRPTYAWLQWPSELVTAPGGSTMRLADPSVFRSEFHGILATYFGLYPDGRLKFNLYGLAPGHLPHQSLTVWELEQVSTIYPHKTDYYL